MLFGPWQLTITPPCSQTRRMMTPTAGASGRCQGCWLGDQSRVPLRIALAGSLIGTPGLQCCTEKVCFGAGMPLAGGLIRLRQPLVHLIITLPLSRNDQEPSAT